MVWTKKELKEKAHDLMNLDASYGPRHGPPQGFNKSKLVPRQPNKSYIYIYIYIYIAL